MSRHSAQGDPSSVRTRELALPTFLSAGLCGGAVLIFAATASGYLPGLPDRGSRLPGAGPTTAARLGEVDAVRQSRR